MPRFERDIEVQGGQYFVTGNYDIKYEDASFSHEFGVEHRTEVIIENVEIEYVAMVDQDGEEKELIPDQKLREMLVESVQEIFGG